jgi:hypothetical protein
MPLLVEPQSRGNERVKSPHEASIAVLRLRDTVRNADERIVHLATRPGRSTLSTPPPPLACARLCLPLSINQQWQFAA